MAIFRTTLPTLPEISRSGTDHFAIGTLPELLDSVAGMTGLGRRYAEERARDGDWAGGLGFQGSIDKCRAGDLSGVAKSDALLTRYEALAPVTRKMRTIASVAGGCPNVGAYLAGSPMAMRRRQRMMDEAGPLAIIVDTVCSAGVSHPQLEIRGAAILALVRLLSLSRPVALYVGCSMAGGDSRTQVAHAYAQIDTSPLDLARSAFVLSSPAFCRGLLYGYGGFLTGASSPYVQWPYSGDGEPMRKHAHKILGRAIDGEEFLFVPGAHLNHKNITQPDVWLADMLKEYGARASDDEAA